jgi:hypothetical protein
MDQPAKKTPLDPVDPTDLFLSELFAKIHGQGNSNSPKRTHQSWQGQALQYLEIDEYTVIKDYPVSPRIFGKKLQKVRMDEGLQIWNWQGC